MFCDVLLAAAMIAFLTSSAEAINSTPLSQQFVSATSPPMSGPAKLPSFAMNGGTLAITDLYSNMPANWAGLSGSGAAISIGCISAGCPKSNGQPYDSQRAQLFIHTTTQADAAQQEYAAFLHMDANTGYAPFWIAGHSYAADFEITNYGNSYKTKAACTSGASGGPTGTPTSPVPDGSCSWSFLGEGTNGKTTLGIGMYCGPGAGSCWGEAINAIRAPGGDLTRFSTDIEFDNSILDGDHPPGSAQGDAYGVIQGGVATNGSGTVGDAIAGGLAPQPTTLSTSSGSPTATVLSGFGIYLNQIITAASVPAGTYITAINGNTITMSQNATATANVAATFVNYMWHCGFCIIGTYVAKDQAFSNGSNSTVGFVNNAISNGYAGFEDIAGTSGAPNPIGFAANGYYGAAAFDATAAHTGYAFRANVGQKICGNVNDACFYRYTDGGLYIDNGGGRVILDTSGTLNIYNTFKSRSATPTVSACGTSSTISGSSQSGVVTIGIGTVTACTLTLAAALSAPFDGCTLTPANATAAGSGVGAYTALADRTTTSWIIRGTALAGAAFNYVCM